MLLAWAESAYRNPGDPATPLRAALGRGVTVHDLVPAVPPPLRQDLHALLAAYRRDQHPRWAGHPVVLNPTFAQSEPLGGADADWIIDTTLWDLKTTTRPRDRLAESLLQLIGYGLSDTPDTYGITTLGLYSPPLARPSPGTSTPSCAAWGGKPDRWRPGDGSGLTFSACIGRNTPRRPDPRAPSARAWPGRAEAPGALLSSHLAPWRCSG